MTTEERCTPWFYPPIDSGLRLCSPFETIAFKNRMDILASKSCKVCTYKEGRPKSFFKEQAHILNLITSWLISGSSIRALWWLTASLDMMHLARMHILKLPLSSTACPTATRPPIRRPPRPRPFAAATSRPSAWTRSATWPGRAMPREGPQASTLPSGQHQSSMNTSNHHTTVSFSRSAIRVKTHLNNS